ncbi:MAG: efflux RND transporter periplasmic adaptor subunit [Myxococcales bacterium]
MNQRSRAVPFPCSLFLAAACAGSAPHSWRTDPATRGPVTEVVNATGGVEAIITVNVGSQVSGTVLRRYVDFNSAVKKGQLLAELDPRLFRAALARASAALAAAEANVEKAQAALHDSERQENRVGRLQAQKLVSQAEVETALSAREQNAAALSAARAAVLQARADRDTALANLAYARIESPIDGIVVSRSIDEGQTVAAAFQAPTLFTIANDLTKMQILANIDEADVGKVHEGQATKFTVDAYPGEEFHGTIREVRQAPTTIQNVVTYAAVIDAPNPERKLRQGMTAAVQVTTSAHADVLRVSNAALRFKPPDAPAAPESGQARAAPAAPPGQPRPAQGRTGRVWKLAEGKLVPIDVRLGLSDGQRSEVSGDVKEGDELVVGEGPSAGRPAERRRGPI